VAGAKDATRRVDGGWRWTAIAGYAVVIAMLTLTSRRGTSGALTPNFEPLATITELLSGSVTRATMVNNLVGNLVLFAPLAVLLRLLVTRSSAVALMAVLGLSVLVEVVQGLGLPDGRQANVDDVLLNVAGAAAALALFRLVRGRSPTAR
jgi:glycopeptide antibiotics resistance protein